MNFTTNKTTNKTTNNVDNKTYNITIVVRNNYYRHDSNRNTTC